MRKMTLFIAVLSVVIGFGGLFMAEEKQTIAPSGVPPGRWIPLTENFGFVPNESNVRSPSSRFLEHEGTLFGTFMVRKNGRWYKLYQDSAPARQYQIN